MRFNPHISYTVMLVLAVLGSLCLTSPDTPHWYLLGQILGGLSLIAALVAALTLAPLVPNSPVAVRHTLIAFGVPACLLFFTRLNLFLPEVQDWIWRFFMVSLLVDALLFVRVLITALVRYILIYPAPVKAYQSASPRMPELLGQ